mmetsp:Transcript_25599/g.56001  ORF Transcript_25599/g.56001 Transcript_25599/m.56001 type:complete len:264 (-) Transcript_25599:309-1100(-)|eukprot:CAMPEP_0178501720 /NCGR_PEP_ID=MMETSP0696-20121128/17107_1 /TAXON_ID=265572 /ORGANISM="Extubocellulus spinifer, Strain CCMP396" /LENGTH=263 /DNA_ID=CAMNT_0020130701 /DNA_START=38 /DNA_END=829 /DNA_ORIENTATION=+
MSTSTRIEDDDKLGALGKLYASMTDEEMKEMFDESGQMRPMDMSAMFAEEDEAWEVVGSMPDSDQKLIKELVGIFGNPDTYKLPREDQEKLAERALEIIEMKIPSFDPNLKLLAYGQTFLFGAVSEFHHIPGGLKLVQALLDAGADPSLGNNMDDETALDFLTEDGEDELGENSAAIVGLLRGVGAKTNVQQMEEQLQERLAEQREEAKGKCANCGKIESPSDAQKLCRCTACKVVYYCGKDCQRNHWTAHKSYCKRIQSIEK